MNDPMQKQPTGKTDELQGSSSTAYDYHRKQMTKGFIFIYNDSF